jgi:RNA polymerase sigma factor (sigma-70 family)
VNRAPRLLSDERLAVMVGTGSDPAFAMLYRRYDGPLHGYCLSIVKNAEDARDVLQSAWMKALVALRSQTRRAPVRPWLFRIVHNEAIDVIRRRRGDEPLLDSHQRSPGAAGADEEAVGRERVAEVVNDLRGLPEGQRAALVMREWADFEYGEIALALATSEGNARQLVFTARSGLAESRAGRTQSCDAIRLELAGADGRRLRNRRIRSHLDCCEACRQFSAETRDRRRAAAAVLLPWAGAGPELLGGILGTSATAGGVTGGSALLGGLAKGAAVAALVAGGAGGAELAVQKSLDPRSASRADVVRVPRVVADRPSPIMKATRAGPAAFAARSASQVRAARPVPALAVTKSPSDAAARANGSPNGGPRVNPPGAGDGGARGGARPDGSGAPDPYAGHGQARRTSGDGGPSGAGGDPNRAPPSQGGYRTFEAGWTMDSRRGPGPRGDGGRIPAH